MSDEQAFSELLTRHFSPIRELTPSEVLRLYRHYSLLLRWNKVLNLTSIRRTEDAVVRHYCESLFVAAHLPAGPLAVLDVGSGAGFPGVPIAVLRPDCAVTLAESHRRKAVFLREATRDYPNVRILARRAQFGGEAFDWVVSRAVRWEDVVGLAGRSVALLLGEDDARQVCESPGFRWEPPVRLPWGQRRFLVRGHRG